MSTNGTNYTLNHYVLPVASIVRSLIVPFVLFFKNLTSLPHKCIVSYNFYMVTSLLNNVILAAEPFRVPVLRYLIANGRVHPTIVRPSTLLACAITHLSLEVIDFLLSHESCDINMPDDKGYTPLHLLLELHIQDEAFEKDTFTKSPVYLLFESLLERGADPLLPNRAGETPLSYVKRLPSEQRNALLVLLERSM